MKLEEVVSKFLLNIGTFRALTKCVPKCLTNVEIVV
jgi:hypothetical protein